MGNAAFKTAETASFLTIAEIPEAKQLIQSKFIELTGKPYNARVCGYGVLLKLYVAPEEIKQVKDEVTGKMVSLWRPPTSQDQDKYVAVSGLVVDIGPDAFSAYNNDGTPRMAHERARVGDWVMINRYGSTKFNYRGVAMALVADDQILAVIEDPTDVGVIEKANKA